MAEIQDDGYLERIKDFFAQQAQAKLERDMMMIEMQRAAMEEYAPSAGQLANFGGMILPGAGLADAAGEYPALPSGEQPFSEAFSGEAYPSMAENIERGGFGGYFDAGMQGLGVAGDALYATPVIGPILGGTAGTVLKTAGAAGKIAKSALTAQRAGKGIDKGIGSLKNIEKTASDKGIKLSLYEKDGVIDLSKIIVPEKGQGVGSETMREIIKYADQTGQTIKLTPTKDFGATSVGRLKKFYKQFGFVENKGRNKDFDFRDTMYRLPKKDIDQGIGALPRASAAVDNVPNRLNYTPYMGETGADALPKKLRDIETRFANQLNSDIDGAIEQYKNLPDSDGGRIISADTARELSPDYVADRSLSVAVHEPSSALIKEHYARMLKSEVPPGKFNEVLFTAGGTGAGKSTALADALLEKTVKSHIVYDGNLAGFESSRKKIQQALDSGKDVTIAYVYRHPIEALTGGEKGRGAMQRAERMGRTVPIDAHASTHVRSIETTKKLAKYYDGNPNVDIRVIDNSRGPGEAIDVGSDLSRLPEYDYNELLKEATNELNKALKEGKISQKVYDGFIGS